MKIFDPLWGEFPLPGFLVPLVTAPEFRRLSNVRLLNVNSPSLASLSDVTRYSHTLGVLRLALENPMMGFSSEEHRAFLAAVLVHDAGTPAFAHLFEYFLGEQHDWSHESVTPDLLAGRLSPDEQATQIFYSQRPRFKSLCEKAKIDFDLVFSIISKSNRASPLLFGSLDYDNLDNVARMSAFLGRRVDFSRLLRIASEFGVSVGGEVSLPEANRKDVRYWLKLRKAAYEILIFDPPTVSAQAVLSTAIEWGLRSGALDIQDWTYTDSELVSVLRNSASEIKIMIDRDFLGTVPEMQLCVHLVDQDHPLFYKTRSEICARVLEFLSLLGKKGRHYAYCFRDRGAFEKRVVFLDPVGGREWAVGRESHGLIVYGFSSEGTRGDVIAVGRKFSEWAV